MDLDSLADKVIQANEQEFIEKGEDDEAPEKFYTDDLGFWVKQDIRKHKDQFAKYVLFRCKYLNPHLNIRHNMMLYNSHTVIRSTSADIALLADMPESIPAPIAAWVYKRLLKETPYLDRSKIEVAPGLLWDVENAELIQMPKEKYNTVS